MEKKTSSASMTCHCTPILVIYSRFFKNAN